MYDRKFDLLHFFYLIYEITVHIKQLVCCLVIGCKKFRRVEISIGSMRRKARIFKIVQHCQKKSKFPLALKLKCDLEIELFELTVSSNFYWVSILWCTWLWGAVHKRRRHFGGVKIHFYFAVGSSIRNFDMGVSKIGKKCWCLLWMVPYIKFRSFTEEEIKYIPFITYLDSPRDPRGVKRCTILH